MNKRIEIYSLILGLVFLISGIAKSVGIAAFSNTITQYGFECLQFLAPFIVLAEVLLGLLLIFQVWLRQTAFVSGLLIVSFTLIYSYGLVFRGIDDCGCFGKITLLNTSPAFTFIRNIVLIYLLIAIWRRADNTEKFSKQVIGVIFMIMCIVSFMLGYGFRFVKKNMPNIEVEAIANTNLREFINTSKDSTYLVFAFTYTCPYCMNSIENLKQYESLGIVDKVIGLALEDPIAEQKFNEVFKPNFAIESYSAKNMFHLTKSFPVAYYIRNDSVIAKLSGMLPCGYIFSELFLINTK